MMLPFHVHSTYLAHSFFFIFSSKRTCQLIITTYGLVKSSPLDFVGGKNSPYYWDYVILDEGHCIKNPRTQMHKACARIAVNPDTHRLLITGTPIQNNMRELWALFDWATSGKLLGKLPRFVQCSSFVI